MPGKSSTAPTSWKTLICEHCGAPFAVKPSRAGSAKYCSQPCATKVNAKHLSETTHRRPPALALRFLYEDEWLSTRAIAAFYGVSHMSVKRWLRFYAISRRPPAAGLAATGGVVPSREDLRRLVHQEHLSRAAIGQRFGVSEKAVAQWIDKLGIPRPTVWGTRRKGNEPILPGADELRHLYEERRESTVAIGARFGVSTTIVARLCREYGIKLRPSGWNNGQRYVCDDGDLVRSVYEQRVDNWLSAHGISHCYEPVLPFDRRCHADFLANGWYIEIWGVSNRNARYAASRQRKTALYRAHDVALIELTPRAFEPRSVGRWERKIEKALHHPNALLSSAANSGPKR